MSMKILKKIPTRKESITFLKRIGCNQRVIEHCIVVSKYSIKMAKSFGKKYPIDVRLVEIGALLHDAGRALTNGVWHAILGAALIRAAGYSEDLANIVERHIGAGIPFREARALGLPQKSYMPRNLEEKIVCYADKLVRGKKLISSEEAIKEISQKLGSKHSAIKRFRNLHKEITRMTGDMV